MSHIGQGLNGEVITASGTRTIWGTVPIGPSGVAGPSGATGPSGVAGPSGATGPSGVAGPSGATGTNGGEIVLVANTTLVQTSGAAEQTLKSYTFTASSLAIGDQVIITAWGTMDSVDNGNVFFRWANETAGTTIGFAETANGGSWQMTLRISITAAAEQELLSDSIFAIPAPNSKSWTEHRSETEAISGAISVYLRGDNIDGANNNAVSVRGWKIVHTQGI